MKKRTPQLVAKAKQLIAGGKSKLATCRELGIAGGTLYRWLDDDTRLAYNNVARLWRKDNEIVLARDRIRSAARYKNRRHETVTYFVKAKGHNVCKIGRTNNIVSCLQQLQRGSAVPLVLLGTTGIAERELHLLFHSLRLHGEWFKLTPKLKRFIRDNCEKN